METGGAWTYELGSGSSATTRKMLVIGRDAISFPTRKVEAIKVIAEGRSGLLNVKGILWFSDEIGVMKTEQPFHSNDAFVKCEILELR